MVAHTCHARRCETRCKPTFLMCGRHWAMVPVKLQRRVWATYRRGQCDDKDPSEEWHEAADAAIGAVALKEWCPPGRLSMSQVRALLALAPEAFGDDVQRMRDGVAAVDARRSLPPVEPEGGGKS